MGVAVTVVVAGVAVPERVTTCGEFVALSKTAILPVKLPEVVGANVALIVQLAPPANVDGATGQVSRLTEIGARGNADRCSDATCILYGNRLA